MNTYVNFLRHTHTHFQNFSLCRSIVILIFSFFIFTSNIFAHTQEWLMQITYLGNPVDASIYLYSSGQLIREGDSIAGLPWAFNPSEAGWQGNFGCDVQPYVGAGQTNSALRTWDIIDPGEYIVRIKRGTTDIYFDIVIPIVEGTADFNLGINLDNNTITYIQNGRGVYAGSIQNSVDYSVTLKNSFNADGVMLVDNANVTIPMAGKTYTWTNVTFPHSLEAIDQQPSGSNYMQRFDNWTGPNYTSSIRAITINAGNGIYTAYFENAFPVIISGPTNILSGVDATWNATVTGGYPPYHYQWWYKYPGGLPLLNTSSVKKIIIGDPIQPNLPSSGYWNPIQIDSPILTRHDYKDHYLKCIVTDAPNITDTSNIMYITVSGSTAPPLSPLAKNDLQQNNLEKSVLEEKVTENSLGNYPNPFNPSTIIRYQIVKSGHVTLKIYDTLGREIANLVDKIQPSGRYSVNFNASNLSSGIYIYRLVSGNFSAVGKMNLMK